MKRLIATLAMLVAAFGLTAATRSVDASAAMKPDSCPTDKPLVVNSYATFENAADYGADGHVWALDAMAASIRIWRLGGDAYCVQLHDVGTSTTFAGLSPEGTGTVSGGETGSFDGTLYARLYGRFAPTVATTGFLGNFDRQCQQDGTCAGPGAQQPSLLLLHRRTRVMSRAIARPYLVCGWIRRLRASEGFERSPLRSTSSFLRTPAPLRRATPRPSGFVAFTHLRRGRAAESAVRPWRGSSSGRRG